MMTAIPDKLNRILEEHRSLAEYLREDYKNRIGKYKNNKTLPFDRIPLEKLVAPKWTAHAAILESYSRRRAINSLLTICAATKSDFAFSNKKFLESLRDSPHGQDSLFNKAIRIEPCLLQTRVGLSVLEWWPLWERSGIHSLGVALRPKGKSKIEDDFEVSTHTTLIKKALLLLQILASEATQKLTDEELFELLSTGKHGLSPKNYGLNAFGKLRRAVFLKNRKN